LILPFALAWLRIRRAAERIAAQRSRRFEGLPGSDAMNAIQKMLAVSALYLASTCAFAQTPSPQTGGMNSQRMERMEHMGAQLKMRFEKANTTHDGKLTREQAASGMPMVAKHFDEIDTQKAGYVTLPQIETFMQKRAPAY
jgi:hypothetical protein